MKTSLIIWLLTFPSLLISQEISNSIFNNPIECKCETCQCVYNIGASISLPLTESPIQFIGDRNRELTISMGKEVIFWGLDIQSNNFKIDIRKESNAIILNNIEIYSDNFHLYVWEGSSLTIWGDLVFNESSTIEIDGLLYVCGEIIGGGTIIGEGEIILDCKNLHTITIIIEPYGGGAIKSNFTKNK